ncbi:hypothetical protein EMN47_20155 [Prolixibacteraceae bacterium JC049]|nr:hypothetical protein [Prolixibacteraceae bacterium JC049]
MFYDSYISKSNKELIEILNSDSYQLLARETAQKILDDRKINYEIKDEKSSLSELNCFQLFEKLEEYRLLISTSERKKKIEIKQDNNGLRIGILFFILSFIALTVTMKIITEIYIGTYQWGAGARAHILKGWGIGTVTFFIVGLLNYQRDQMSAIKINLNKNSLQIRLRKIWKKEILNLKLNESEIAYKKLDKEYVVFIPYKNRKLNLFKFKDNNVGNKTDDYLSITFDKLNNEIKNCW